MKQAKYQKKLITSTKKYKVQKKNLRKPILITLKTLKNQIKKQKKSKGFMKKYLG